MREFLQVNMAFSSFPLSTLIVLVLLLASVQSNSIYGKKWFIFFLLTLSCFCHSVNTLDHQETRGIQRRTSLLYFQRNVNSYSHTNLIVTPAWYELYHDHSLSLFLSATPTQWMLVLILVCALGLSDHQSSCVKHILTNQCSSLFSNILQVI